jgi:hypothetical protein
MCLRPRPYITAAGSGRWPLKGGQPTNDLPAIGYFTRPSGACTATLVAPRIALTAAHCIDYKTNENPPGHFGDVQFGTGRVRRVVATRSFSDTTEAGPKDVGLLVLDDTCSNAPAPINVGAAFPSRGTDIAIYGFGCTVESSVCRRGSGGGTKQIVTAKMGETASLCPGDSGGPVLVNGQLVGINSGNVCWTGADIFADATAFRSAIEGYAAAYGCPVSHPGGCPNGAPKCMGQCCTAKQICGANGCELRVCTGCSR